MSNTLIGLYQLRNDIRESMFDIRREFETYHDIDFYHKMWEERLSELDKIDKMIDECESFNRYSNDY